MVLERRSTARPSSKDIGRYLKMNAEAYNWASLVLWGLALIAGVATVIITIASY